MALLIDEDYDGDPLPEIPEGYRILQHGEVLLPTDEVHQDGNWTATSYPTMKVGFHNVVKCVYRRKVLEPKPTGRPIQYVLID
jgi:hypothetical protein